jgi:peptidoglycan LD-endopeptidase LytH
LANGEFVEILGQSRDWYRVALADRRQGFISVDDVGKAETGELMKVNMKTNVFVELDDPSTVVTILTPDTTVRVLASHKHLKLIRTSDGTEGWIQI